MEGYPSIDPQTARILFSKIRSEARRRMDQTKCLICGSPMTSACNSHTVPQFVLNYISDNGHVSTLHEDDEALNALLEDEIGINKADTFHVICRQCDQRVFSVYESEERLLAFPKMNKTDQTKVLSAIFIKIALDDYYKKLYQKITTEVAEEFSAQIHGGKSTLRTNEGVEDLDMAECAEDIKRCKRYISEDYHAGFKIIYSKLLPYRISVACQIHLSPERDLDGNLINDIYNFSPNYRIVTMCLCLFPLKEKSFVLLFGRDQDVPRLSGFIKQFDQLKESQKQSLLFSLALTLSEDVFYTPEMKRILEKDPKVGEALGETLPSPYGVLPDEGILIRKAPSSSMRDYLSMRNYLSAEFSFKIS